MFHIFMALWILGSPDRLLQSALEDLATRIIIAVCSIQEQRIVHLSSTRLRAF